MTAQSQAIAAIGKPPVTLRAYHDQLKAAIEHARTWTSDHPGPDRRFRRRVKEFIDSCAPIRAVMLGRLTSANRDTQRERFEQKLLMERISVAVDARAKIERRIK